MDDYVYFEDVIADIRREFPCVLRMSTQAPSDIHGVQKFLGTNDEGLVLDSLGLPIDEDYLVFSLRNFGEAFFHIYARSSQILNACRMIAVNAAERPH